MEYQLTPWPPFQRASLRSSNGRFGLQLSPDAGCCILSLKLAGHELLAGYSDGPGLDANRWARGNFLFPFPNRLRDGQLHWKGRTYTFPINDPITGNALHGLLMKSAYLLEDMEDMGQRGRLCYVVQSDRELESYPFAFRVQHAFTLDEKDGFQLDTTVTNMDREPIPVGWGWHPYLQLGGACDGWHLRLPPCKWLGVDERMLPTGKSYPYVQFDELRPIGAEVLDNCLALQADEERAEVLLEGPAGRITYWQEAGPGGYPFLQVFTHPMRESIALEPMTCAVDGLNTGRGRMILEPGETARASFGLRFEAG